MKLIRFSISLLLIAALVWFGDKPYSQPNVRALLNEVTK